MVFNLEMNLMWGVSALIAILLFMLIRQYHNKQHAPVIDAKGPASRRYSLDRWDIVGYVELDQTDSLDKAAIKKARRARADVIAYERSGLWVYLKKAH